MFYQRSEALRLSMRLVMMMMVMTMMTSSSGRVDEVVRLSVFSPGTKGNRKTCCTCCCSRRALSRRPVWHISRPRSPDAGRRCCWRSRSSGLRPARWRWLGPEDEERGERLDRAAASLWSTFQPAKGKNVPMVSQNHEMEMRLKSPNSYIP